MHRIAVSLNNIPKKYTQKERLNFVLAHAVTQPEKVDYSTYGVKQQCKGSQKPWYLIYLIHAKGVLLTYFSAIL